jgi:hypothetical protein
MSTPNPEADRLIHEIGAAIVQSPRIAALDWQHLVLVANVEQSHSTLSGFSYDSSGKSRPVSPGGMETLDKIGALREAMRTDALEPWIQCLIRIQRDTGKIAVDFEYEDPSRWAITPANVRQMAEQLRPQGS